jgi:hypothetical protein
LSAPLPFDIQDLDLRQGTTKHGAVVIVPRTPMFVGSERLARLQGAPSVNQVERALIAEVKRRGVRVVLFRGMNDEGRRVWEFDPAFDEHELENAGVVMSRALLPLHRRLMAAGVMIMVHTDWGRRESGCMRHGIATLLRQYENVAHLSPLDEAHRWLLTHMLLYVSLDHRHVIESLLPSHLTLIDRRWPRVRELVAKIPAEEID